MTYKVDWESLDWSKSVQELAQEIGCKPGTVHSRGRKLGKKLKQFFQKPIRAEWVSSVDWNKKDIDIAKEVGLSRERIRQVRASLDLPSSALIPKQKKFKVCLRDVDWSQSNKEIAQQNNIHHSYVSVQRKYWAPHTKKSYISKEIIKNIDWSLKQKEIQNYLFTNHNIKTCQTNISRYKRIFAPHLVIHKYRKAQV